MDILYNHEMRYIGIDYGTKRIGIALSDTDGMMAFPKEVVFHDDKAFDAIIQLIEKESVGAIVMGESKNLNGVPNSVYEESVQFANQLTHKTNLPVFWEPEFFTSQEAERLQGKNTMHDASAAAIILKSFLDKQHNNANN